MPYEDYSIEGGGIAELSDIERFIVKQAVLNAVADDVKTNVPDNLRGRLDSAMKASYYENPMAGKSYDLKLMGQKVGTYSLTVSKGKPSKVEQSFEVDDHMAFAEWAENMGFVTVDMDAVMAHFKDTGEVPEGCSPVEVVTPEVVGGVVTRTTVRVDSAEVARVLGPMLEPVAYALLEG